MRITRDAAKKLGLDFASLWLAVTPSVPRSAPIAIPDEPALVYAARGEGWWEVTIFDWRPSSKNEKTNPWAWSKARKRDDAVIGLWAAWPIGPLPATCKRRVTIYVTRKRTSGRMVDPQNVEESLLDSLVVNKLLVDDSAKWCARGPTIVGVDKALPCKVRTIVRLEDL